MIFTDHSLIRSQQRGVKKEVASFIYRYGKKVAVKGNNQKYFVNKKRLNSIKFLENIKEARLIFSYLNKNGEETEVAGKGRHDACVVPRAVPIVTAMTALVLVDHLLRSRISKM